jgi:hypothetical protein
VTAAVLVGFDITKQGIFNTLGGNLQSVRSGLANLARLRILISTLGDDTMLALGISAAELQAVKDILGDMYNGQAVLTGQQAQPAPSNFFFNADAHGSFGLTLPA